jgi:hypothetical protein
MISIDLIGTITIANGATVSDVLAMEKAFARLVDLIIYTPAALTGTCTLRCSWKDNAAAGTAADWRNLYINGADVDLPANKAVVVPAASWQALSIISGAVEGAIREFQIMGQME